ncbi:hypothetical protein BHE74_00010392 [Ensete ventricosum]|uniref:Uncharacterized protein n=1 Tax=Ensete ventricosum TaxID=4639 RepID=A0A444F0R7_ENSVE|nr:hypothetical protein B296_00000754 [Ensete ventricosum]RWW16165.1 hypothetical protein GW17_00019958 [Ensete ventricosum]RWW81235.1 hypothetical protein BHE74_00010392 [Ensete ventricosum]RZR97676.1 hypothetical protein BHM03_00026935 [Ensete ventricosum]
MEISSAAFWRFEKTENEEKPQPPPPSCGSFSWFSGGNLLPSASSIRSPFPVQRRSDFYAVKKIPLLRRRRSIKCLRTHWTAMMKGLT